MSKKSDWFNMPTDAKQNIIDEYVTAKWHLIYGSSEFESRDYYETNKKLLYRIFGREVLKPHELKVTSLATFKPKQLLISEVRNRVGFVVDAMYHKGMFFYLLTGSGEYDFIADTQLKIMSHKEYNELSQWTKYKVGGIIKPNQEVAAIPNVRNSFGKIVRILSYREYIYIVADYGIQEGDWSNIFTEVFENETADKDVVTEIEVDAPKEPKTYLMHDSNTGYTKIGKSVNPRQRERTLQSEKPTITMFAVCDRLVERELHTKYADKRIRGEWFDLTDTEVQALISDYGFNDLTNFEKGEV